MIQYSLISLTLVVYTSGDLSDSDEELGQGDNERLSQLSWSDKNIQVYIYIYYFAKGVHVRTIR